jgi:hypothetical protein
MANLEVSGGHSSRFPHLANATMRPMIESVCDAKGLKAPIICTPEELLESIP